MSRFIDAICFFAAMIACIALLCIGTLMEGPL